MHTITIGEKRSHEFEIEQGGVYGRAQEEGTGREGYRNEIIMATIFKRREERTHLLARYGP